MRALALLLALVALVAPGADAASPPDVVITLASDGTASTNGPGATLASSTKGERYVWNLTLTKDFTVVEVRSRGAFDVVRAAQILPLWRNASGATDDHFFFEVPSREFEGGNVANVTGSPADASLLLGIEGAGVRRLVLERDVEAPDATLLGTSDVTHFSFLAKTRTDEYAWANLLVRPASGGEWIANPTTIPSIFQTFPVQGLKADTEYVFKIVVNDWSGNVAETAPQSIRTLPKPQVAEPTFSALSPPRGAVVDGSVVVRASVAAPQPIDSLRLFFDKKEVSSGVVLAGGNVSYDPGPLGAGLHSVSIEARTAEGGEGNVAWTFTVEGGVPGVGALVLLLGVALGAFLRSRGR